MGKKKICNDKQAITFLWIMAIHGCNRCVVYSYLSIFLNSLHSNTCQRIWDIFWHTFLESGISASFQYVNVIKLIDTIAYLEFFQFAMSELRCVTENCMFTKSTMYVILTKLNGKNIDVTNQSLNLFLFFFVSLQFFIILKIHWFYKLIEWNRHGQMLSNLFLCTS